MTPTLIDLIKAARDEDDAALEYMWHRLAPALICAVEALEEISRFHHEPDPTETPFQNEAYQALVRIREMLEGKEPKV
jgi:hypothetical protein